MQRVPVHGAGGGDRHGETGAGCSCPRFSSNALAVVGWCSWMVSAYWFRVPVLLSVCLPVCACVCVSVRDCVSASVSVCACLRLPVFDCL